MLYFNVLTVNSKSTSIKEENGDADKPIKAINDIDSWKEVCFNYNY